MSEPLLVAQDQALHDFLDALLTEDADSLLEIDDVTTATACADEAMPATDVPPVIPAETTESINVLPAFTEDDRTPVLPDWGLQPFQAMVFKVGELSLAIPLTELAGVVEWQPAASANGLCLGEYQANEQSTRVLDIARLVFAGNHFDDLLKTAAHQRITRIIFTNNGQWGLACDAVHEVITIQPTQVNWRSTRTRRQWLAGTLLDDMIVVLDVESMAKILSDMLADLE